MPQFQEYKELPWYPHMAVADTQIWSRFIVAHPDAYDAVAYDVAVGEGAAFDTTVNHETGGNIARLYQRRIDVVGVKGGKYSIIEVGPRASTAKIGQVKAYAKLFARDFPAAGTPRALIITDALLPEMEFLAKDEGVELAVQ